MNLHGLVRMGFREALDLATDNPLMFTALDDVVGDPTSREGSEGAARLPGETPAEARERISAGRPEQGARWGHADRGSGAAERGRREPADD